LLQQQQVIHGLEALIVSEAVIRPDPFAETETALKTLRAILKAEAQSPEEKRKAIEAVENALKKLKEQLK
jgi:hypothetical protein